MEHRTCTVGIGLIRSIVVGPGAKLIGILGRDEVVIWRTDTEEEVTRFELPWQAERLRFEGLGASCSGRHFVAAGGARILICDVVSRELSETQLPCRIADISISPEGSTVAVLAESSQLHVFREQGERLLEYYAVAVPFAMRMGSAKPFAFDRCGRLLAVAGADGYLRVVDLAKREVCQQVQCPGMLTAGVAISRDTSKLMALVVVDKPFTGFIWDLKTGRREHEVILEGPEGGRHDQALSPFGAYWASICEGDKSIELQAIPSGRRMRTGRNFGRRTTFSVDGDYLAAFDFDEQLHIWSLDSLI